MSYILEALKKSQQERELGQVPTLDASGMFSEDREEIRQHPWGLLAVGLAAVALVIALYAVLRDPPSSPTPASRAESSAETMVSPPRPLDPPAPALAPAPTVPLVEAPPPKSRPHAVLPTYPGGRGGGEDGMDDLDAESALDPELERELRRQLEVEESMDRVPEVPARPGVPSDLIDDIEAFKQQVRRERGIPPPESERRPAKISGDPTRLRLSAQQQALLPAYLMTAHVYDSDPSKRFVLINALKYREGEETREGMRVERIIPEGAVLSYLGNPFFVPR